MDILVNNAGIPENGGAEHFASSKPESWMPYLQLNLLGSMPPAPVDRTLRRDPAR